MEEIIAGKRKCKNCGRSFIPCPKVPNHKYCGEPKCKKEVRRLWKKKKFKTDKDYPQNQADYYNIWKEKNPDYWKKYRKNNPDYVKRNRELQRIRNKRRKNRSEKCNAASNNIAKETNLTTRDSIPSGYYKLIPLDSNGIAKGDELMVKIDIITKGC
jgi:hypothetical protein